MKKMTREQLEEFMNNAQEFVTKCEAQKIKPTSLQASLMSIVIIYVEDFHSKQSEQLQILLHQEAYEYRGLIPAVFQQIVNQFIHEDNQPGETLIINNNHFKPANSLLMFIKMISDYFDLTKFMFIQKYDVASRLFRLISVRILVFKV